MLSKRSSILQLLLYVCLRGKSYRLSVDGGPCRDFTWSQASKFFVATILPSAKILYVTSTAHDVPAIGIVRVVSRDVSDSTLFRIMNIKLGPTLNRAYRKQNSSA